MYLWGNSLVLLRGPVLGLNSKVSRLPGTRAAAVPGLREVTETILPPEAPQEGLTESSPSALAEDYSFSVQGIF